MIIILKCLFLLTLRITTSVCSSDLVIVQPYTITYDVNYSLFKMGEEDREDYHHTWNNRDVFNLPSVPLLSKNFILEPYHVDLSKSDGQSAYNLFPSDVEFSETDKREVQNDKLDNDIRANCSTDASCRDVPSSFHFQPIYQQSSVHPSIPLISNVVVTGQESFLAHTLDGDQEGSQILSTMTDELDPDYNSSSSDNCTANASCGPIVDHRRAPTFQQSALARVVILMVIAIFSLVGNIATLGSILRTGRQSTSTVYMLLVQLAIADLLVSVFCILVDALWTLSVQWYGGNFLCKWVKFMQLFSLYLSTFLLVLIGFDRLCAVRFPMRRARAKHHVRNGIVCVWTLSALFSLPQAFIFSVMRGPFSDVEFYQCVTYAFYTAQWQEQLYTTLSLVLMFILPLFVLVSTYLATFLTIASREKNDFCATAIDCARKKILRRAKLKSLTITVVIVVTFMICWTPYYVTMIIFMFLEPSEQLGQELQKAVFFFGSSTAAINPLIYGAFHLRPRTRRYKSTTNTTSTANVQSSSFRKSRHSNNINLHMMTEGKDLPLTGLYKYRYSCMNTNGRHNRVVHQSF